MAGRLITPHGRRRSDRTGSSMPKPAARRCM
jgi:hypothetical protein